MDILRPDPLTVSFREISPFLVELLRQIPREADPGDDKAARERLFSKPVGLNSPLNKLNEEWAAYVEPSLRHLFQSANETVSEDLKNIVKTKTEEGHDEVYSLDIPVKHIEQWLGSLNQARLVMAAKNAFTEEELAGEIPIVINSTRDMNLLQIHLYADIQGILLRYMEL